MRCQELIECIKWYEGRGLDWSEVAEYIIRKHNGSWPEKLKATETKGSGDDGTTPNQI